jgi:acetate kinase
VILVLNAGSSNIKFALFDASNLSLIHKDQVQNADEIFSWLANNNYTALTAIGHRIVHGGSNYFDPVLLNASIIGDLQQLIPLAPLHQPHNLALIEACSKRYPNTPQIGCFDTGFHKTQHKLAKLFALPSELTNAGIIRYGFHGLSYEYIASILEGKIGPVANNKVIIAHLGGGASACAMQHCRSVATTMGFSALDGLMMGTRCGTLDAGVILYLLQEKNYTSTMLQELLYHKSGLLGVSGLSADMKILEKSEHQEAILAIELFCYKAACEIGALTVALQGLDALIFTGGIGEHSPLVREKICHYLAWLGVKISLNENTKNGCEISASGSKVVVAAIPTNEEYMIAKHTLAMI